MRDIRNETMELVYSRNKWRMLCNHFGESADKSCAATFIDRITALTTERDAARAEIATLEARCEQMRKALGNMIREWCEIVGDEMVNGTPADTLEEARDAYADSTPHGESSTHGQTATDTKGKP